MSRYELGVDMRPEPEPLNVELLPPAKATSHGPQCAANRTEIARLRKIEEAARAFVAVWGETEAMESSHVFAALRAALEATGG